MAGSSVLMRVCVACAAVCVLFAAGGVYWESHEGRAMRVNAAAFISGYDGCFCPDCTSHYLGIATSGGYCCRPARPDATDIATLLGVPATASLLVVGPLWAPLARLRSRRRHDPDFCRNCRYPRAGLAGGTPCPECGLREADEG